MRRDRSPAALALSSAGALAAIAVSIPLGRYASTPALWSLVAIPVVLFVASGLVARRHTNRTAKIQPVRTHGQPCRETRTDLSIGVRGTDNEVELLWSPAGASGGNPSQLSNPVLAGHGRFATRRIPAVASNSGS
jgi:hypothetical protein